MTNSRSDKKSSRCNIQNFIPVSNTKSYKTLKLQSFLHSEGIGNSKSIIDKKLSSTHFHFLQVRRQCASFDLETRQQPSIPYLLEPSGANSTHVRAASLLSSPRHLLSLPVINLPEAKGLHEELLV